MATRNIMKPTLGVIFTRNLIFFLKNRIGYIKFKLIMFTLFIICFNNSIFAQDFMVLKTPQQNIDGIENYMLIYNLGKGYIYIAPTRMEELPNSLNYAQGIRSGIEKNNPYEISQNCLNPFVQPWSSSKYYGSGDVDGDGSITISDYFLIQKMVSGEISKSVEADVNADGVIDSKDLELINEGISGSVLPGWWNRLQTRTERNSWVSRILSIDKTNFHPGHLDWYVCADFASQLFINFNGYRKDLRDSFYDGGIAKFNIPLYPVIVYSNASGYGHAINAVLVGDNPLNFYDWRFIEPQTDFDVIPGGWDMPYGTTVAIWYPEEIIWAGTEYGPWLVEFNLDLNGTPNVLSFHPDLIVTKPTQIQEQTNNIVDQWYPKIVNGNPNTMDRVFFYSLNLNQVSMSNDIFFLEVENGQLIETIYPAIVDETYSYFSDALTDEFGTTHLIWKGEDNYSPGIFYTSLNNGGNSPVTKLSNGDKPLANHAILIMDSIGNLHALWVEPPCRWCQTEYSIIWRMRKGSSWDTEKQIVELGAFDRKTKKISITADRVGNLHLVYQRQKNLFYKKYDGSSWNTQIPLTSISEDLAFAARNPDLTVDNFDNLHLLYELQDQEDQESMKSDVYYKRFKNGSWEQDIQITHDTTSDEPNVACYNNYLSVVWQSFRNGPSQVFLKIYDGSFWTNDIQVSKDIDAFSQHPKIGFSKNGDLLVCWQEKKEYSNQVRFAMYRQDIVSTPNTPSGPTMGAIGENYSYTTGGASSHLGYSVEYQFDWKGDGSDLSLWGFATQAKTWTTPGQYNIRARARCAQDICAVSDWSSGLSVTIVAETVSTPNIPSGPTMGTTSKNYTYSTAGSTSNLGHTIQYQFDWMGNGSNLPSWGSATQSRTWTNPGIYNVRARARCTQDTSIVSNWSDSLPVSISVPKISVTPTTYGFGNVKMKRSKTASFKVANNGTANLSILASTITGTDASMFKITSGGGNRTIKPGKTLTIKVAFKPTSTGSKTSALRITSNDSDTATIDILLSGTGQ